MRAGRTTQFAGYQAIWRRWNGGAHSRYVHEFQHEPHDGRPDDHTRLRDTLARFKRARVVVSYYDCPRIRALYQGWTFVEKARLKNLTNAAGPESKQAPEILIINGPSLTAAAAATGSLF